VETSLGEPLNGLGEPLDKVLKKLWRMEVWETTINFIKKPRI
jgi:hypothetical protein